MNCIKDKVIIIDEDQLYICPKEFNKNHQCYLDEFAKNKRYEYSSMEYLANKGNCVFEIAGPIDEDYFIGAYLPKELSDMQIYYLELLEETFSSANLIDALKVTDNGNVHFSSGINEQNCAEYFYNVIMPSYFEPKIKK